MPLPTVQEMVGASVGAFAMEMNAPTERRLPRASGIGDCARKQAYSMRNVGTTNAQARDGALTTEQGRQIEDLSVELIRHASQGKLVVANRQVELPGDFPMTGHPDGQVVPRELAEWDSTCSFCGRDSQSEVRPVCNPADDGHLYKPVGWVAPLDATVDGDVIGFEHKHLGYWGYEEIFKRGFADAEPGYYAQTLSYGNALNWNKVRVVVLAQDSASTSRDANINLGAKNPKTRWANSQDWHPKLQIVDLDLGPTVFLQKRLRLRAEWLTQRYDEGTDPGEVMREADPTSMERKTYEVLPDGEVIENSGPYFPCSHCPWLQRCLDDGEGTLKAPALQ